MIELVFDIFESTFSRRGCQDNRRSRRTRHIERKIVRRIHRHCPSLRNAPRTRLALPPRSRYDSNMRSIDVAVRDVPRHSRPPDDPLTTIREQEAAIARAQGERTRMLASLAQAGKDNEFLPEELAPELGCSPVSARHKLEQASELCGRLPATVETLCTGEIDWAKAVALADITRPLSTEQAADVEQWTLRQAANKPYAAFTACARRRVHRVDPNGAAERAETRRTGRRVWLRPLDEGICELGLQLPAELAIGAWQRIDALARQARSEGDTRSIAMVRADVTADLLLSERTDGAPAPTNDGANNGVPATDGAPTNGSGSSGGSPATRINVTVDIATLLGLRAEPATLHGYGPIDADTARTLAADATWRRIITDPADGTVVDVGRRSYRPPTELAERVVLRDQTCAFPGCPHPAETADLDHTVDWQHGGHTAENNLGALCRRHHRMKHDSDWELTQPEPGWFQWVSPRGKTYTTEPEPLTEPNSPPDSGDVPPF